MGKRPVTMSHDEVNALLEAADLELLETHAIGVLPATDNHMLVPSWVHRIADRAAAGLGLDRRLAQDLIFVCRHTQRPT